MNISIGTIGNWNDCYLAFDRYESGSIKSTLYSYDGKLLLDFTMEGEVPEKGSVLYAKAGKYTDILLGKMAAADIIYGYIPMNGFSICAVNEKTLQYGEAEKPTVAIRRAAVFGEHE